MINVIIYILLTLHVLCSILLTLLILMQRPKSEGLGAAFGSGVTESIFGAGTSDVLTKMTIWLGSIFIGITLLLAILYSHRTSSRMHQELLAPAAAETVPATSEKASIPKPVAPEASAETSAPVTTPAPEKAQTPAAPTSPAQSKKP